jgi:hypothetical protein
MDLLPTLREKFIPNIKINGTAGYIWDNRTHLWKYKDLTDLTNQIHMEITRLYPNLQITQKHRLVSELRPHFTDKLFQPDSSPLFPIKKKKVLDPRTLTVRQRTKEDCFSYELPFVWDPDVSTDFILNYLNDRSPRLLDCLVECLLPGQKTFILRGYNSGRSTVRQFFALVFPGIVSTGHPNHISRVCLITPNPNRLLFERPQPDFRGNFLLEDETSPRAIYIDFPPLKDVQRDFSKVLALHGSALMKVVLTRMAQLTGRMITQSEYEQLEDIVREDFTPEGLQITIYIGEKYFLPQ